MTSAVLANELSTLISEAKRKNADLRNAAEKSLQDLKALTVTSEQQLAADLRGKASFIEPFVIACSTHSTRLANGGILCLQRLIISKGLPKARLQDALAAFLTCADLGVDIQLKILQALPSLLQNYAEDLKGDLLSEALQLSASLAASKTPTVSGVAAATLQQLVTMVFENVTDEDRRQISPDEELQEVPGDEEPVELRPAAFDAYRVFRDLALAADNRQAKFVSFSALPPESSLELIWSAIDANPDLFIAHDELLSIIGANIFPLIIRGLSEKLSFSITIRLIRILDLILDRYMLRFPEECEVVLNLCTQALEPDYATSWKRALVLEVLRDFFADSSHVVEAYSAFDARDGGKPIISEILSAFVRLSTEKPVAIGLGQQSSVPVGPMSPTHNVADTATLEAAGGMAGVISSALGVTEANVAGVSSQWSLPRAPCMEQLDKADPPSLPETYPYTLVLECLNGLSDTLARIILPLTVQQNRGRSRSQNGTNDVNGSRHRSTSFRTHSVPLNPLDATDAPYADKVRAVAGLVDRCWPAVLATSSTFLNAALDDQYFRNLIKAYQRFAQVAGLLRLSTPRDALMTTLAKAAIPPHVLNAAFSEPAKSPTIESPRIFSNPKGLLSVDSLVSQASSLSMDTSRRISVEPMKPTLTVRNLLCLRALLNLAIALGPTLGTAYAVVINALKQADMVLSASAPQQLPRQPSFSGKGPTESPSIVQAFTAEVNAVEAAASRLLESTADYPNDAFVNVIHIFCQLLRGKNEELPSRSSPRPTTPKSPQAPFMRTRTFSGIPGISSVAQMQARDYQFVIPKLGNLAELNISRFAVEDPAVSGWAVLLDELLAIAKTNDAPKDARRGATSVLVKIVSKTIADVAKVESGKRAEVQRRSLSVLVRLVDAIYAEETDLTSADIDVQGHVLSSLQVILEASGDSLVAGWNRIVALISSAFEMDGGSKQVADDEEVSIAWTKVSFDMVSSHIGRMAFAATQLLCSDFMESLPLNVVPSVVELLHRFMCQSEDLNAALTTVTMTWNLADSLFSKLSQHEFKAFIDQARAFEDVEEDLKPFLRESRPAQWLLVLFRLRAVAVEGAKELRNAAFQTLCNVFRSYGQDLDPDAWDILLRNTLLHISRADSMLYLQEGHDGTMPQIPDIDISKMIVEGNSAIIAQHLRVIEKVAKLPSLWELFLSMLERYLDVEDYVLNATVYSALSRVLSVIDPASTIWKGPIYRTVSLWLKRVPHFAATDDSRRKPSNQDAYTAYAAAGDEVYRLIGPSMSTSQTRSMIDNLYHCVRESDGPAYGADVKTLSPLQGKVLSTYRSMRSEEPQLLDCLITVAAKFATLHHDATEGIVSTSKQGPTFVALSFESVSWLEQLVMASIPADDASDGARLQAIQGLQSIIQTKYAYQLEHKDGISLWRKATETAVKLARPLLERAMDTSARNEICSAMVGVATGIVSSNDLHLVNDSRKIYYDEIFDIESFETLRSVLIPRLGATSLSPAMRLEFVKALFNASIIHQPQDGELAGLAAGKSPLEDIGKIRRGRVKRVPFSLREEMAYACWKELIALACKTNEQQSEDHENMLAQVAAPLVILRLAIPLRAYIADQPLRGRGPQPLSEKEELLFSLESIKDLELDAGALGSDGSGGRAHVRYLYPLLVKAVAAAADPISGHPDVLRPLQEVLAKLSRPY